MFRRSTSLLPVLRAQLRFHSTETTPKTFSFPQLNEISVEDIGSSSNTTKRFGKGAYHLQRSQYGNLPIYVEYKDNDNIHTEIRKISGDVVLLRNDLVEILDHIPKKNFKILNESKKILIKGNHKEDLVSLFDGVF
jgi:large subunit ribosomal protein L49